MINQFQFINLINLFYFNLINLFFKKFFLKIFFKNKKKFTLLINII